MNVNMMQMALNGLTHQWSKERAETQMTLGGLIDALSAISPDAEIQGIGEPHSYRGYYTDLSFEPLTEKTTGRRLLQQCEDAMGEVFQGYKGGDYTMGRRTPVWIAHYGCRGDKIIGLNDDGSFATAADEY